MMAPLTLLDTGWLLVCSALVFVMQVGFCCLETGLVRTKNSINVAIKNLLDMCIVGLIYWAIGFGLMFGESKNGFVGTTGFLLDTADPSIIAFFLFQIMFCGAATTIIAGAIAERMKFTGYVIVALIVSAVIYPIFGHWTWGMGGWLKEMGFHDFAGSTTVHSIGGWVALAACLVIGPRLGFERKLQSELIGHNLPLATIGVMFLWFGWFGFNGGSGLLLDISVPYILTATALAAMAGGMSACMLSWMSNRHPDVVQVMNGILAGLVSITACCDCVSLREAVGIGAIGGVVSCYGSRLIARFNVDDVVGAVSTHALAGVWGTIAVAIFGESASIGTGLTFFQQLGIQALGIVVCFCWAFGLGYTLLRVINAFCPLRVSEEAERVGLNVSEHNATTETQQLVREMDEQRINGDFSQPVSVESYTEIGQIAAQYNRVLSVINGERKQLVSAEQRARAANADLQVTQGELEQRLEELEAFNDVAVDREVRMVELKEEINALHEILGRPVLYETDVGPNGVEPIQGAP